jgi:hypothetical protein
MRSGRHAVELTIVESQQDDRDGGYVRFVGLAWPEIDDDVEQADANDTDQF